MRLLVISDIHANLSALQAVLADAAPRGYDRLVCLGDALGYGPQPREVLEVLLERGAGCVLGNHDAWAISLARGETGPREGGVVWQALAWQVERLGDDLLTWVASWPELRDETLGKLEVRQRHGSPLSLTSYVDSLAHAREAFAGWPGQVCLVGHTHLPAVYATLQAPVGEWVKHQSLTKGGTFVIPPSARVILNPGSVGQPRDGDPRASYALLDTERGVFDVHRATYDVDGVQRAVQAAGLPEVLGSRLMVGK